MTSSMDETSSMEEMPCCPPEKSAIPDCQKACPLMAVCMAKCFQNLPLAAAFLSHRTATAGTIAPLDDARLALLNEAPPPKPPRT